MTLREVMHAHIPTLHAASTVRDAVDKMDIYQFPGLVLVGEEMEPLGVLTEGDLSRAAFERGNVTSLARELASRYATRDPVTMSPEAEVSEAFHKMLMSGLTVLPVVENNRLAGIVLRCDLMQAMMVDLDP